MPQNKKLIEVSLPLDAINAESAREKSIRHGHPSTLHLWWSRKPLATARAVIWSSLVDDPSSHPELFPTEEEQARERERLHKLLANLVKWENSNNQELLDEARAEIKKYMGGEKLVFLDPFAGGGSLPLEAQRLGLEAHAHDLNPVAVMINKAMIEIPPKFAGHAPVNPDARREMRGRGWPGASGLAEDVRYYGQWLKEEARKRVGHLYPKAKLPDGGETTVIAWLWARAVKCPNPACGCEMPLASSFVLSKKKGREVHVQPKCENGKISYTVKIGTDAPEGTVNRNGAKCICCKTSVDLPYIREQGRAGRMGSRLIAIVAEGPNGRIYLSSNKEHIKAADIEKPVNFPEAKLPHNPRDFKAPNYGLNDFSDLFTPRQLTALTTFSELVAEAQAKAENDAKAAGMPDDGIGLAAEGTGAKAYGEAVGVYLAFVVDRQTNYSSTLNIWADGFIAQTYGRQALPMIWDYAETNIFSHSSGCFDNMLDWVIKSLQSLPANNFTNVGNAIQQEAQAAIGLNPTIISTDPPYYDNIGYADLSDYFYIWMRQALKNTYPDLFRTMLVPKKEELVATPYRFEGDRQKAKEFFESGMFEALKQLHKISPDNVPVTIYYAFKQKEADDKDGKEASTGWETMLSALIASGFMIVGTWPLHTERETGLKDKVNALASSIVLVCRKRPDDAPKTTRRNFIRELKKAIPPAIRQLQGGNIAPVDMAQAAIGPGMTVYSRYAQVLGADGSPLGVRGALQMINAELDSFLSEQEGAMDEASRFCVDLYRQSGFNDLKFGEADVLARARNTSVKKLADMGLVYVPGGLVRLVRRKDLPERPQKALDLNLCLWLLTQYLVRAMDKEGIEGCAKLAASHPDLADAARDLAYRLFSIAERRKWNDEAFAYNSLVAAWPEIREAANRLKTVKEEQGSLV